MSFLCIFYKSNDPGYEHAKLRLPIEAIPKVGEFILLDYPDGGELQKREVIEVVKLVYSNELVYQITCSERVIM